MMNQNMKADDTSSVHKQNEQTNKYPPAPPSISGRSTASYNPNIPPPMAPPSFMPPPPPQLDWWGSYGYGAMPPGITNPSPFDVGYKEEMNTLNKIADLNNNRIEKKKLRERSQSSDRHHRSGSNHSWASRDSLNDINYQALNQKVQKSNLKQPSQINHNIPPPSQVPPNPQYMDPAYMYYMMAAAAAAYNPNPFGYPPFQAYPYPPIPPQMSQTNRYYPDDDRASVRSFFGVENQSEKDFGMNRARSIAGDHVHQVKQQPFIPSTTTAHGLLIKEQKLNEDLELVNQELTNINLNQNDQFIQVKQEEIKVEQEKINRMTPQIHQLPHIRCSFSFNSLIRIRPNDPCDGQPALVDIFNLSDFMENHLTNVKKSQNTNDDQQEENEDDYKHDLDDFNYMNDDVRNEILTNYKLLQEFPGPLSKDSNTSKAQVIQFCLKNVKECLSSNTSLIDPQSHALLWDFLALLVRQNGIIDLKTDVSPLLLSGIVGNSEDLKSSESTQSLNQQQTDFVMVQQQQQQTEANLKEDEVNLNRLRQLLGAGQKSDAIEYTIKHNMWPHALFLASSTFNSSSQTQSLNDTKSSNTNLTSLTNPESKILSKVKLRFIGSLPQTDPILTCYQLLMGRVPASASSLSKSEWNDWRRHLAMIVSNVDDSNRSLVLNTIKTMGDSLASNGRIAASHFCYLLSNCAFGTFNKKSSKLVLIGSSHNQDFNKFCQISAIQATEIYEYAQSLLPNQTQFNSDNFLKYKLIYASRLLEHGLLNEAYKYVEVIAKTLNKNPSLHTDKLSTVFHLANRLKVHDPDYFNFEDTTLYQEPIFLKELTQNYKNLYSKNISHLVQEARIETVQPVQVEQESYVEPKLEQQSFVAEPSKNYYEQQTSMPFYPQQVQEEQPVQQQQQQVESVQNNYDYQNDYQNYQQQYEQTHYPQQQYEHVQNHHQQFEQQQQQQPTEDYNKSYYQYPQNDYSYSQTAQDVSRKSSVNSLIQPIASTNNYPNQYQKQRNLSSSNISLSNENNSYQNQQYFQPNQYQQQPTRSRASSTSTSYNDQNQFYDPNTTLPKSQTFPQQQQPPQFFQPMYQPELNPGITEESSMNTTATPDSYQNNYQNSYGGDEDDDELSTANPKPKPKQMVSNDTKEEESKAEALKKNEEKKAGWLDWFKKPNGPKKMVLPDDKKKTIVWDDKLKKYVNKDSTSNQESHESIKPPPVSLPPSQPMPSQSQANQINDMNRFSLKNSNSKRPTNYYAKLDIMADKNKKLPSIPSGVLPPPVVEPPQSLGPLLSNLPPPSQLPPRFFVPEPNQAQDTQHQQQYELPQQQQYEPPQQQQQQQETDYQNYYQEGQQQQQGYYYNPNQGQAEVQQQPPNYNI